MSKRKTPTTNYYPAADLNLDILLLLSAAPPPSAAAKKLKSSSMDAQVPDRDRPDDDSPATSDSSSDVINTEEEPFPRSFNNTATAPAAPSFVFDIWRKEVPDAPSYSVPTTHQLFPESSAAVGVAGSELNLLAAPNQWLKLSEAESIAGASAVGGGGEAPPAPPKPRKSRRGPRSRSSQYRGVTFYRRTGRWESHIWDCGKQVYLGGFDTAHAAARAYDRAAIKFRGVDADINFTLGDYDEDMKATKDLNKEEFVHVLRRQSTGFSRGSSKYRGVNLHKCGQWEARMGQLLANKAHDKAAIEQNSTVALTNFQPRELNTNTFHGREDDLDLRLGMSPKSTSDGRKKNPTTIMEARVVPLVDKTTATSVDGPSSRAAGPPFGFQPIHGLPINIASNNFSTWPPPPPSSAFDPQIRGSGNIPTTAGGQFASSSSWAHHQQFTGVVNTDGVPMWPSPSPQQQSAASSGFLASSSINMNRPNARVGGGGSSSPSPNVNNPFFQNGNQYCYSHNRPGQ
ncbi:unnamed protein product [Linum tenue]|uniref:AP2/ERF domain-containing protein n=1 Tax=Linum tenue TaxID=586396 RepID=A0AAV0JNT3_9ROSI|nr:unnamed protein product [Linum tenue]